MMRMKMVAMALVTCGYLGTLLPLVQAAAPKTTHRPAAAPTKAGAVVPDWKLPVKGGVSSVLAGTAEGVYVGCLDGTVMAVDPVKGKPLWTRKLPGVLMDAQLVLCEDSLLAATDRGLVHALDTAKGNVRWTANKKSGGADVLAAAAGRVFVRSWHENRLVALKLADGSALWTFDETLTPGNGVAVADGKLVVVAGSDLVAVDATNGKGLWRIKRDEKWQPRDARYVGVYPTIIGSELFFARYDDERGYLLAADFNSGKVKWSAPIKSALKQIEQPLPGPMPGVANAMGIKARDSLSAPIVVDDTIYLTCGEQLHALDKTNGTSRWSLVIPVERPSQSSVQLIGGNQVTLAMDVVRLTAPVSDGNLLYLGADDGLYAIDPKTRSVQWKYSTKDAVERTPLVGKERLLMGTQGAYYSAAGLGMVGPGGNPPTKLQMTFGADRYLAQDAALFCLPRLAAKD